MAQTVIPFSFETYLQKKLASGDPVTLNKIVLANIPDLDLTQPIPRDTGLPTHDQIVHEQIIDQVGKINTNALAYSIVMDTTMGDFTFNAMYLIDKDDRNSIGMIVWKLPETKTATNEQSGTTGNSLVKSMLMEYDGAATAAAITVTAATWQIDYSARLIGIDDDVRLQALDVYGHDAFIDDGFVVTKATNTDQYFVNAGIGYIGGLRAVLAQNQTLTISTKPTSIWVSVSRQGTVLGAWSNAIELKVSATVLTDNVVDGVDYYVAKIVDITADGSVIDLRNKTQLDTLLIDFKKGQFQLWDPLRAYEIGEKTSVKQGEVYVDFWCNKSNVNHKPINQDPTDTWRLYPFEKGTNQGATYKIWFNNDVEIEGTYSLTSYKAVLGGNIAALYDGSTSILLPIPLTTVTTCHVSQSDSGNVGVETTTCVASNNYLSIRAGGIANKSTGSDSYIAKGTWLIKGHK
ncbi:hypothetical protein AYY19_04135 [Photobacterium aquimaris]|uniref:phage tail-collar fiber domain-containing protein n=1 Tax=Photobacterium aquimaris TaxID=512643 RepID=UPI0007EF7974|nr:phage tail protein [Photobacterium aquimaris]OBU16355.1 hypothetical protein AYY19_04135 [Photobacterium aquimaris]PSW02239.1 hypothetical protein CTM91_03935 [Photobacterium aquimaris]